MNQRRFNLCCRAVVDLYRAGWNTHSIQWLTGFNRALVRQLIDKAKEQEQSRA